MRNSTKIIVLGTIVGVPLLSWYLYYSAFHAVFKIKGDVVDEQGKSLDATIMVSEGQFISITQESDRSHSVETHDGNFDIRTVPCDIVSLIFYHDGYAQQHISYGHTRDALKPLHIVMHRPQPSHSALTPEGKFKIDTIADCSWGNPPYLTVALDLNADGTATSVTTLPDNKTKISAKGTWTYSADQVKDRITIDLKQLPGQPDPAGVSTKPLTLDMTSDGQRLIQRHAGPWFNRILN